MNPASPPGAPNPPGPAPAPPPGRRAWPAILLGLLAAVVAAKAYLDRLNPPSAVSQDAIPASVAAASAGAQAQPVLPAAAPTAPQWGQPGEAAARVARAASAALASARAAAGLDPATVSAPALELCGLGRLDLPSPQAPAGGAPAPPPLQAAWQRLPPPLGPMARDAALQRLLPAMSAPARPDRERAAAWVWQAAAPSAGAEVAPPTATLNPTLNAASAPATRATDEAQARARAVRSLARLARASPDATVLHWALALCAREAKPSAECRRISVRDLARKAPEDGLSWLAQARRPGVSAAERDSALAQAAQALAFGGHAAPLPQAFEAAWPQELPGYLLQDVLHTAQHIAAGLARPAYAAALELCTAEALGDEARRGPCEALARRLSARGSDFEALEVVAVLGARLGWAAAELEALQAQQALLAPAAAGPAPGAAGADQPYACSAVEATREWVQWAAAEGEVQAARRRLATSPMTARPAPSRP